MRRIRKGQNIEFCDMAPPPGLMEKWIARKDNQIMGLELLSIALGARAPGYAYRLQCLLACWQESVPSLNAFVAVMWSFIVIMLGLSMHCARVSYLSLP